MGGSAQQGFQALGNNLKNGLQQGENNIKNSLGTGGFGSGGEGAGQTATLNKLGTKVGTIPSLPIDYNIVGGTQGGTEESVGQNTANYAGSKIKSPPSSASTSSPFLGFNGAQSNYANSLAEQNMINGLSNQNPNTNFNINAQNNPYNNNVLGTAAQGMKTASTGGKQ